MSNEVHKESCASCGLSLDDRPIVKENEHNLCSLCTSNGITKPKFEIVVYTMAIGYFMNEKQISDPKEAVYRAHHLIAQQPYWRGKESPALDELMVIRMAEAFASNTKTSTPPLSIVSAAISNKSPSE